jgi:hypothetical protein
METISPGFLTGGFMKGKQTRQRLKEAEEKSFPETDNGG